MKKYQPFAEYLASHPGPEFEASFAMIERILHARLPQSAYRHRAWWANNGHNRAFAQAWLAEGWQTADVDLKARRVRFVKASPAMRPRIPVRFEDLYGALKGYVQVPPGVDLTEPAWPGFADYLDEKYGPEVKRQRARR